VGECKEIQKVSGKRSLGITLSSFQVGGFKEVDHRLLHKNQDDFRGGEAILFVKCKEKTTDDLT